MNCYSLIIFCKFLVSLLVIWEQTQSLRAWGFRGENKNKVDIKQWWDGPAVLFKQERKKLRVWVHLNLRRRQQLVVWDKLYHHHFHTYFTMSEGTLNSSWKCWDHIWGHREIISEPHWPRAVSSCASEVCVLSTGVRFELQVQLLPNTAVCVVRSVYTDLKNQARLKNKCHIFIQWNQSCI